MRRPSPRWVRIQKLAEKQVDAFLREWASPSNVRKKQDELLYARTWIAQRKRKKLDALSFRR